MLSAIKTGKKKKTKKQKTETNPNDQSSPFTSSSQAEAEQLPGGGSTGVGGDHENGKSMNASAADKLRLLLQSGVGVGVGDSLNSSLDGGQGQGFDGEGPKTTLKLPPAPPRHPGNDAVGTTTTTTIATTTAAAATTTTTTNPDDDTNTSINNSNIVVLPPTSYHPNTSTKSSKYEDEMTVTELAARERATSSRGGGDAGAVPTMSWDEAMTRNVYRVGKKRKMKMKWGGNNYDGDSDEEVEQMKRHLPGQHQQTSSSSSSAKEQKRQEQQQQKEDERTKRRLLDLHRKEQTVTSKCHWWVQSSNFAKQRLVAFGDHVLLMMAPLNSSLVTGQHFYIVPIKHAPSFVDCSDAQEVWEEVRKFRQALENVYARDRKGIVMTETVIPSRSNTASSSSFWQTKLEVVPVPFSVLQDAPLYFKQSMMEQAEEWGTHNKVLPVMNPHRPLPSVIPKGFPYFSCDFGNLSTSKTATGYAQIIESSSFSPDFGNDTLASMMELDPIRFGRKKSFPKGMEEQLMNQFMAKWKPFDWTTANKP